MRRKPGQYKLLKFRSYDHQIEAEDQALSPIAFQKECGNLDPIEHRRGRRLPREIPRQTDRAAFRCDVAKGGARKHIGLPSFPVVEVAARRQSYRPRGCIPKKWPPV